jgi:hypothetical protein
MGDSVDLSVLRQELAARGEVRLAREGGLKLSARPKFGFNLHWLREVAPGQVSADLGLLVDTGAEAALELALEDSFLCVLSPDEEEGWIRLRLFKRDDARFGFASRVAVSAQGQTPREEISRKLAEAIARLDLPQPLDSLPRAARELAERVCQRAAAALEKKYSAELSYRYEAAVSTSALLDCSFAPAAEGEQALSAALAGDFSPALAGSGHVRVRQGILTHSMSREAQLELHLPFLDRAQWLRRWEALAKVEIETGEDGRLMLYTVEAKDQLRKKNSYQSALALSGGLLREARGQEEASFTLSYTDRRRVSHWQENVSAVLRAYGFDGKAEPWWEAHGGAAGGGLEVAVTLSVPGELVRAWLRAPGERDPEFFPTYAAVSLAVQRVMRQWLPYVYFSDPHRYDDLLAAWPLLIYQSMPPFPGQPRYEFTHDVMDCGSTRLARRSTLRKLTARLERLRPFLIALGKTKTARFYAPDQAAAILAGVARQPRLLNALLAADAFFVDALVRLGLRGHAFTEASARNPARAVKELARFAGEFVTTFHRRLRRLYGGRDFLPFGTLLLIEATRALNAARGTEAPVSGILRVALGEKGQPGYLEQTFVNAAYRP